MDTQLQNQSLINTESNAQPGNSLQENLSETKTITDKTSDMIPNIILTKEQEKKSGGYFFGFGISRVVPTQKNTQIDSATTQLENQKNFLTRQCVLGEAPLRCYIVRDKGLMALCPTFRMYIDVGNGAQDTFLMSCSKSALSASGGYFLISMDKSPGDRESPTTIGKLRSNDDGSQFFLYDTGENPKNSQDPSVIRKELALMKVHKAGSGASDASVSLTCWLPSVLPDGSQNVWQPRSPQQSMDKAVALGRLDQLVRLSNKAESPLDYQGRVTEPSVKNFQLVSSETGADSVLLFGKVKLGTLERFSTDLRYPLSPLQAFAICVMVLDSTSNSKLRYR